MRTTTYGYKVPEVNDNGAVVADAIEDTIDQLNLHAHDGVTSAALYPSAVTTQEQTILPAEWASVSTGLFVKAMAMPVGLLFNKTPPRFFHFDDGYELTLSYRRTADGAYQVFTWDNSLKVRVVYR